MERADMASEAATKRAEEKLESERLVRKQAEWDANWGKLRGLTQPASARTRKGPVLRPGERIVMPGEG